MIPEALETKTVTLIWLISAWSFGRYLIPLDGREERGSASMRRVVISAAGIALLTLLLVAPALEPEAIIFLALAVFATAFVRLAVFESFWQKRPFDREILQISLSLALLLVWWWFFGAQSMSPGGYYQDPRILKMIALLAGLVFVIRGGTELVRKLLKQVSPDEIGADLDGGKGAYRAGQTIGNLERTLIFGLAMAGELTAIGFVLTAKSVARFARLEEQEFAEYYLLGTLASTLVALAGALAARTAWQALAANPTAASL